MSKYWPLQEFLENSNNSMETFTIDEIETLLGFELPYSALVYRPWWGNSSTTRNQSEAWMAAGWRVANVNLGYDVTFVKVQRSSNNTNRDNYRERYRYGYRKNTPPPEPPQSDMLSFYRTLLGLRLNFTQDELKTAYREAAGKYHPDRYTSSSSRDRENAEILMKQINEAYEFLKSKF